MPPTAAAKKLHFCPLTDMRDGGIFTKMAKQPSPARRFRLSVSWKCAIPPAGTKKLEKKEGKFP
jgi:hypothetical protein